jgi:enterochelin esterase-like enzyme
MVVYYHFPIFENMEVEKSLGILKERVLLDSTYLDRNVTVDFYLPKHVSRPSDMSLLLINDGQDMDRLGFKPLLDYLYRQQEIVPLLCVGIHAGAERKLEYGTARWPDFKGRGSKAKLYTRFVLEELIPYVRSKYVMPTFKEKAFAGFSLGGLSALDIVLNHPGEFSRVGIFSGSLWWRLKDKHDESYSDETDRIMHQQVKSGEYFPWLKFFFQCGTLDEDEDRNGNGVIDSIDDTLDLIKELQSIGYDGPSDIYYLELPDGKHDVATWGRAMPEFLKWGWGR